MRGEGLDPDAAACPQAGHVRLARVSRGRYFPDRDAQTQALPHPWGRPFGVDQERCTRDGKFLCVCGFEEEPEFTALRAALFGFGLGDFRHSPDEDDGTGFTGGEATRQFTRRRALPPPVVGRTGAEEEQGEPWKPAGCGQGIDERCGKEHEGKVAQ
jgi:hypothetical protein